MPLFEYRCAVCDKMREVRRSWEKRDEPASCVHCGGSTARVFPTSVSRLPSGKSEAGLPAARLKPMPQETGIPSATITNCRWETDVGVATTDGHIRMSNVRMKCRDTAVIARNSIVEMDNVVIE